MFLFVCSFITLIVESPLYNSDISHSFVMNIFSQFASIFCLWFCHAENVLLCKFTSLLLLLGFESALESLSLQHVREENTYVYENTLKC